MSPEEIFIRKSVALARSMPINEAVIYLRGLLNLVGDCEATASVRQVFVDLSHCDCQLELITIGQLKLNLQPHP